MKEQLLSYEVNTVTGCISIRKRKYVTEVDEFGNNITKPVNWRGVIGCGNEEELYKHLPKDKANFIKKGWSKEMIAKAEHSKQPDINPQAEYENAR